MHISTKINAYLKRRKDRVAYELLIHLPSHRLHGPFNFATPKTAVRNSPNIVGMAAWKKLEDAAKFVDVDVDNIHSVVPLRKSR